MDKNARLVRSINLAGIVISGIEVFGLVTLLLLLAISAPALNDPDVMDMVMGQLQGGTSSSGSSAFDGSSASSAYDYAGMSSDDVKSMFQMGAGYIGALLACKVVALVAAITAFINWSKPERLGAPFVLAVIASFISMFTGSIISVVLYICSAFYISRTRKLWAESSGNDGIG